MPERIESGIRGLEGRARPPRLGKLRLGIRVPNRNGSGEHPERIDYFRLDDDRNGRLMREFLGGDMEPREIPIQFVSNDPDEVAPFNFELYGGSGRKCVGNGHKAEGLVNVAVLAEWGKALHAEGVTRETMPLPPVGMWASGRPDTKNPPERRVFPCLGSGYDGAPACPMYGDGQKCGPTMHLTFAVRGFPALGTWEITTGSTMNIERVQGFLAFLAATNGGRLAGVPLILGLDEVKVRGQSYSVLRFDFDATEAGLLPGMRERALLPPPAGADGAGDGEDAEAPADDASEPTARGEVIDEPPAPPPAPRELDQWIDTSVDPHVVRRWERGEWREVDGVNGTEALPLVVPDETPGTHASVCPLDQAQLEHGNAGWGHRVSGRMDRIHLVTLDGPKGLPRVTVVDAGGNPVEG